jgi:hypothetical protein
MLRPVDRKKIVEAQRTMYPVFDCIGTPTSRHVKHRKVVLHT